MLADWNRREQELIDTNPTRVPPLANAPLAATAHMGKLKGSARDDAAATGARTVPPRDQGDGEITFCGAIEMAGWVHMKVELIKGGMAKYGIKNPVFKPSPITPNYKNYLIFEGISVDEQGQQHYLDVNVAYRQACLNAINYLTKFGYSPAQGYALLGSAPVQGHISGVVDIPNACATLWLPTEIFEFDINPNANGPTQFLDGSIDLPIAPDL
eukprot:gene20856-24781_t